MTKTAISARRFEGLSPQSHSLVDSGSLMRSVMIALPLLLTATGARAEPTLTLDGMWQLLGACAQSVRGPAEAAGSEVTALFSIKRDGSLQGQPRITHSKLVGDDATQQEYLSAVLSGVARCFTLAITDGLGGAVAGRPLRLRVMNRAKEHGAWHMPAPRGETLGNYPYECYRRSNGRVVALRFALSIFPIRTPAGTDNMVQARRKRRKGIMRSALLYSAQHRTRRSIARAPWYPSPLGSLQDEGSC